MENFTRFFFDKDYIELKNYLFNYLNRKRLIKLYSKKFIKNGQIIDIGCGVSPVSPNPERTTFFDISKEALRVLNKKGYKTKYGSITNMSFSDDSIDYVFCSEVLEHVKDYKKGINEISRILKNAGYVFITVPCWKKYWNIDDEFVGHYRRFDPDIFREDLKKSGLKVVSEKNIGSKFERLITILLVKKFSKGSRIKRSLIIPYKITNYFLSYIVTFLAFLSRKKDASIILFILQKL